LLPFEISTLPNSRSMLHATSCRHKLTEVDSGSAVRLERHVAAEVGYEIMPQVAPIATELVIPQAQFECVLGNASRRLSYRKPRRHGHRVW
jgi:hypothetical protein